jgi:hypothetical protein
VMKTVLKAGNSFKSFYLTVWAPVVHRQDTQAVAPLLSVQQ